MHVSLNPNIPQIYVEDVQQEEDGSVLYQFVCHPGGALVEIRMHVPQGTEMIDGAPLLVWQRLEDQLLDWYKYARGIRAHKSNEDQPRARFL